MSIEPLIKRAFVFFDGQNLFHHAVANPRGINGTDWIKIDRMTYDACLDPNDYRPHGDAK